jgi:GT2 family glycosyltransferase
VSEFLPWRIAHVRLGEDIAPLEPVPGGGGVHVVFWYRDVPLGSTRIPNAELPLRERQLAALGLAASSTAIAALLPAPSWRVERPLATLHRLVDLRAARAASTGATVVVCTRDRPRLLARCLESLVSGVASQDEILVVDNDPQTSDVRRIAEAHAQVRYVAQPVPGLDVARNTGLRHAGRAIVAYCDDDVVVEPTWLARLKAGFEDPAVAAVTGLVLPSALETEAQYIFETHWGFGRGFEPRTFDREFFDRHRAAGVPVWQIGAGASMAFRKTVLEALGGFDERLDAGAAGCSGDSELWYRILANGHRCRYEPSAVSYHSHRRSLQELDQQIYSYMRGHAAALLVQFERHRHWGNLRRLFVTLPCTYARKSLRHLAGPESRRTRTLRQEIAGWLAGIRYYAAAPRPVARGNGAVSGETR